MCSFLLSLLDFHDALGHFSCLLEVKFGDGRGNQRSAIYLF